MRRITIDKSSKPTNITSFKRPQVIVIPKSNKFTNNKSSGTGYRLNNRQSNIRVREKGDVTIIIKLLFSFKTLLSHKNIICNPEKIKEIVLLIEAYRKAPPVIPLVNYNIFKEIQNNDKIIYGIFRPKVIKDLFTFLMLCVKHSTRGFKNGVFCKLVLSIMKQYFGEYEYDYLTNSPTFQPSTIKLVRTISYVPSTYEISNNTSQRIFFEEDIYDFDNDNNAINMKEVIKKSVFTFLLCKKFTKEYIKFFNKNIVLRIVIFMVRKQNIKCVNNNDCPMWLQNGECKYYHTPKLRCRHKIGCGHDARNKCKFLHTDIERVFNKRLCRFGDKCTRGEKCDFVHRYPLSNPNK